MEVSLGEGGSVRRVGTAVWGEPVGVRGMVVFEGIAKLVVLLTACKEV